ncbi:MAG: AbrB/MazE/SpoVT family DNA-binding domain-containing protein [Ruminococcus sp.]|nr:AbrB/MazE/SpoVT family DNA-binding domain-containing protein [Ruminococcus sp.]
MRKHKKIGSGGQLTIPKGMRTEAGLLPGTAIDIEQTEKGLLLKPHVPICKVCGSVEQITAYKGLELCRRCINGINREAEKNA